MGNSRSKKQIDITNNSNITDGEELKQIEEIWNDENVFKQHASCMLDKIKSDANPRNNLCIIEKYIDQCLKELNNIKPVYYKCTNFDKLAESAIITPQSKELIYDVIPNLTQYLINMKPEKNSEFSINHYFQKILILCKHCIELDIECWRLLDAIFGFLPKEENKTTFYDHCGLPIDSKICLSNYGVDEFSKTKTANHKQSFFIKYNNFQSRYYFNENCYELSYFIAYPDEYFTYCADVESISWFRVANINFFGKIGGFDVILNRISHKECCLNVADVHNLILPIVRLRDLYNDDYFKLLINALQNALLYYYRNLSIIAVRSTNFDAVCKLINVLKYMMNRSFPEEIIDEMECKLKMQFLLRQFKVPFTELEIKALHEINSIIEDIMQTKNEKTVFLSIRIKLIIECIENDILNDVFIKTEYAMSNKLFISNFPSIFKLLQFENNNSSNLSKYIGPYLWLVFYHNYYEGVPAELNEIYKTYCRYLITGYSKQFIDKDISNDVYGIILFFLYIQSNQ